MEDDWYVEVKINGESILFNCAEHLLAFIGKGDGTIQYFDV